MKSFEIRQEDDGARLNRYLMRVAPGLPGSLMHRYLREKRIKLNGKRCEASVRLSAGDLLTLYIDDDFFTGAKKQPDFLRASRDLEILFENSDIAVLRKPAGLLTHSTDGQYGDTLADRFLRYLYEHGGYDPANGAAFAPALCNRLDRNTEGLIIGAKNAVALRTVNGMIRENRVEKRYRCVVSGRPPNNGRYTAHLLKNESDNTVHITDNPCPGSKEIITEFCTVKRKNGLSLLDVCLITGRTHQIRAHLRHLGAPIVGDVKYGDPDINRLYSCRRQLLCAYKITLHPDALLDAALADLNDRTFEILPDFEHLYFD